MADKKKGKRRESETKQENKNRLLSFLRSFPAASRKQQAQEIGIQEKSIKDYHKQLVASKRAIYTIVPFGSVAKSHQRFYIFIETTYQKGGVVETDDVLTNPHHYQEWVAREIQKELREKFSETLVSGGVQILLGGDYDLMLIVDAEKNAAGQGSVHDFVTRHVRTRPHVLRTRTTWARSATELTGSAEEFPAIQP